MIAGIKEEYELFTFLSLPINRGKVQVCHGHEENVSREAVLG